MSLGALAVDGWGGAGGVWHFFNWVACRSFRVPSGNWMVKLPWESPGTRSTVAGVGPYLSASLCRPLGCWRSHTWSPTWMVTDRCGVGGSLAAAASLVFSLARRRSASSRSRCWLNCSSPLDLAGRVPRAMSMGSRGSRPNIRAYGDRPVVECGVQLYR